VAPDDGPADQCRRLNREAELREGHHFVGRGRLPDTGHDLCSQPTISRWENAPTLKEIIRLTYALVDIWCRSYKTPPASVVLDIDDTVDVVHGHQKLSEWNAHYDERCFLPIHVYDTATGRPVAVILRPGKTPSGREVRGLLRRLIKRIRGHWPSARITIQGDSHYGREEAMRWCEANSVDYVFGFAGNTVLDPWSNRRPTISGFAAPRVNSPPCAALPKHAMRQNPGPGNAASWRGSRRAPAMRTTCSAAGSTSAMSSPR
jgi:hypothetical protein